MKRICLPTVTLLLAAAPTDALARQHPDLCSSVPAACAYTGPDAPLLDAEVCWSATGSLTLKGPQPCPSGSWAYHLEHGEVVDPLSGQLAGYVPLEWACSVPGICVDGPAPPGAHSSSSAVCCEWGVCIPLNETLCDSITAQVLLCDDGVTNEDGTVTCFSGEAL